MKPSKERTKYISKMYFVHLHVHNKVRLIFISIALLLFPQVFIAMYGCSVQKFIASVTISHTHNDPYIPSFSDTSVGCKREPFSWTLSRLQLN